MRTIRTVPYTHLASASNGYVPFYYYFLSCIRVECAWKAHWFGENVNYYSRGTTSNQTIRIPKNRISKEKNHKPDKVCMINIGQSWLVRCGWVVCRSNISATKLADDVIYCRTKCIPYNSWKLSNRKEWEKKKNESSENHIFWASKDRIQKPPGLIYDATDDLLWSMHSASHAN